MLIMFYICLILVIILVIILRVWMKMKDIIDYSYTKPSSEAPHPKPHPSTPSFLKSQ